MNKKRITKVSIIVLIIVALCIFVIDKVGYGFFTDPTQLKEFISSFGIWAPFVFFSLQFLQVIMAFIPGNVLGVVGGGLFGHFNSFLLNASAIYIGSIVMFMLGKHFSEKVALKFVKEETYHHYLEIVSGKKGKLTLFIAFLLPFFPDDALCLIAGSSNLTYKEFLIFLFLGRTPGIIYPSFLGAGIMGKDYKLLVAISAIYGIILFIIYIFRNKIIKDDIKDE